MNRRHVTLHPDTGTPIGRPSIPVRRFTLTPDAGLAPLDALLAVPPDATGVLAYFPGFNTPLGEWEVAKCQLLAGISGLAVVVTEIPGLSHHGDPVPDAVRRDLNRQLIGSWADLTLRYLQAALLLIDGLPVRRALGYSTGCSLAVAALPLLGEPGTLRALALVEPVSIVRRGLGALAVHDLADLGRLPAAHATNRQQPWLEELRTRWPGDRAVHYSVADLLALTRVLCADTLPDGLPEGVEWIGLARGQRSSLCPAAAFEALDERLEGAGVPGATMTVTGLGHQLWHSFPAMTGIARELLV